jgi:hypothetical protein
MQNLELAMDVLAGDHHDLPSDLGKAIAALPEPGVLPSPWTIWTMITLVVYGQRKAWAHKVIEARVAHALARRRGQPVTVEDVRARGIVAGLPEWEFVLDRGVGFLVHRPTGEPIHVDLFSGERSCYPGQFHDHVAANRRPGPAVRRLVSLHRTGNAIAVGLALDELMEADLLHSYCDDDEFFLCGRLEALAPGVAEFLRAWKDRAHRPWLAAKIGDWSVAHQGTRAGSDRDLIALTRERAARTKRLRLGQLRDRIAVSGLDKPVLYALADVGAPDLRVHLRRALKKPGDATEAALDLIGDDAGYVAEAVALFAKLEVDRSPSYCLHPCAGYLLRQGHQVAEIIDRLAASGRSDPGLTAVLALEYAPDRAPALVRRALRSESDHNRMTVAAALALIDRPWSRAELAAALEESDDADATIECWAALRESRDPVTRAIAEAWEDRHPGHEEAPWLSTRCGYALSGGIGSSLLKEMDRLRDRILPIRDRILTGPVEA